MIMYNFLIETKNYSILVPNQIISHVKLLENRLIEKDRISRLIIVLNNLRSSG